MIKFVAHDGGRRRAGFKGQTGDCGTRAVAIATGRSYQEVYDAFIELGKQEADKTRCKKVKRKPSHPRTGIWRSTMHQYLVSIGWKWTATMKPGTGCKVHLTEGELPQGRLVVRLSKHYAAVVDGVLYDTHDSSRGGTRCVYGYWSEKGERDDNGDQTSR